MNLRDSVIPVLDLRRRFGMPERPSDDRTCLLVSRMQETLVGLRVDSVSEDVTIPPEAIAPPAPVAVAAGAGATGCILGVDRSEGPLRILLDAGRLLAPDQVCGLRR